MFYTCYGYKDKPEVHSVLLCLAVSANPLSPTGWSRLGPVFPHAQVDIYICVCVYVCVLPPF